MSLLVLLLPPSSAHGDIVVMTRNVLHGSNFTPVISAIAGGDPTAISNATATAFQEAVASNYAERAAAVAAEIDAAGAALVGLQEVGLYRSGDFGNAAAATDVELDYLDTLLGALTARGLNYTAAVVSVTADNEVSSHIGGSPRDLRFTNHNVILARTDLPAAQFSFSNPASQLFNASINVPTGTGTLELTSGLTSLDVQAGDTSFRFINTHLESDSAAVRIAQGNELLAGPLAGTEPVVLVGDLNSNANGAGDTTYNNLIGRGLIDAWDEVHPGQPGDTFGTGIFDPAPSFTRRIDFILSSAVIDFTSADVIGDELADRTPSNIWPSDHAGVIATIATVPEPSGFVAIALVCAAVAGRRRRQTQTDVQA